MKDDPGAGRVTGETGGGGRPPPVDYEPVPDPLLRNAPLPVETVLPVLGIPVRFRSNAPAVVEVAETAFERWRALEETPALAELVEREGVEIVVVVHEGDEGGAEHAPVRYRVLEDKRVLYQTHGSVAFADPARRQARAFVTPALVADRDHFRYALLEGMTLSLLTPLDRQPFHAAALVRDGTALLLAGPSGTGKSTLAYAAVRDGLDLLAEDTVFLQSRPSLRIWGLPGFLHLPPDARERFPELTGEVPTMLANGKRKLSLDLRALDALPTRPVVDRAGVCLLRREGGRGDLEPVAADVLADHLIDGLEPGFDIFADTIREPVELLTAGGGWRLTLADHPERALPWIHQMLDEVERR
mgnify:CR=1 FL=1